MTAAESPRRSESGSKEVRFSIHDAPIELQAKAIETLPVEPIGWNAELTINAQYLEYMNNPKEHIGKSKTDGYIPFSSMAFSYDNYSGLLTPNPENPLRFFYSKRKWAMDDKEAEALFAKGQEEIMQGVIEGRRPNRVTFQSEHGFKQFQSLVSEFVRNGYDISSSAYVLTNKQDDEAYGSSLHVGYVDQIVLYLGKGLTGGEVLDLNNWFAGLEKKGKKMNPSLYIVHE